MVSEVLVELQSKDYVYMFRDDGAAGSLQTLLRELESFEFYRAVWGASVLEEVDLQVCVHYLVCVTQTNAYWLLRSVSGRHFLLFPELADKIL